MPVPPKFKYHITVIAKTWADPEDHDKGLNVQSMYDFATTKEEAVMMIKRLSATVPDPVQVLGFHTKVVMEVQELNG